MASPPTARPGDPSEDSPALPTLLTPDHLQAVPVLTITRTHDGRAAQLLPEGWRAVGQSSEPSQDHLLPCEVVELGPHDWPDPWEALGQCRHCDGTGWMDLPDVAPCSWCFGSGAAYAEADE